MKRGGTHGFAVVVAGDERMHILESIDGDFLTSRGAECMRSLIETYGDQIDVVYSHNDEMTLGALPEIEKAGFKPGEDIIIVGCDSVKAAFESIVAGEMNATIECTPLYGDFVVDAIEKLEAGETFDKEIIHPEEGVYDCVGGIEVEGTTSVLAADVIDERLY